MNTHVSRRALAVLLALSMLLCAALTGCGKKEAIASPDQVATAIFELVLKDNAAPAKEALGYESEEAARADFLGDEDDFYSTMTEEVISQFESLGATVSDEDGKLLLDAFLTMMGKLEFSAEVKEMDEKAGTAVVTCHVTTITPDALNGAIEDATAQALSDPELMSDTDALVSTLIHTMADAMSTMEPGDETTDFDTDFSLETVETAGKPQLVWVPVDAAAFGESLSTAALGG